MSTKVTFEDAEDLYQNAPNGYLSVRKDGVIINCNNTLLNWLDYARDEVIFQKTIYEVLGVGDRIFIDTHILPLLELQNHVNEISLTLKGKNGKPLPCLLNGKKVDYLNDTQAVYRFSVLLSEQRISYEQELLAAQKQSEKLIERLKRINSELERFAYTAAHDLKAPLNNMASLTELLAQKEALQNDEEATLWFSLVKRSLSTMKAMIEDLLSYSKLEDSEDNFGLVSLENACKEILFDFKAIIEKHNATFLISPLPMVWGDEALLKRVFQNLFENALKYRSDTDLRVDVYYEEDPDNYTIFVKDNGIGFSMKNAEKVFEFMKRLHNYTQIKGTGIGLATCKRIMEIHNGSIGVISEPGQGSTFYITLPKSSPKLSEN